MAADRPPKAKDAYWLDEGFERAVVTLAASNKRFYGRIANALDPECLNQEPAKIAMRAIKAVARDLGQGPSSPMLVLQRLRRWMDEGRLSLDKIKDVAAMFDTAMDSGLPEEDAAVVELKPLLARRMKSEAVQAAIDDYGRDGNFTQATKLIEKANRLGDTNTSVGIMLGAASYDEIEKLKHLERLSTGILELDDALDGGLRRGSLGLLLGGSNDGKSMGLSHLGAHGIRHGLFVLYATLELPPADVLARVKANLTGIPINAILADPLLVKPTLQNMPLGPFIVQEFTPQATTMNDIEDWVESCEEQVGRQIDLLVTDYGDKLSAPKNAGKDGEHGYGAGRIVFERMRIYANEGHKGGKIWHWSAAQATRQKDKRKKLDLNDVADSMHKVRVADLVLTLNLDEMMTINIAKNRYGRARQAVGPLPPDFEIGRIAPIMEPAP
jgi:hypothetical protein